MDRRFEFTLKGVPALSGHLMTFEKNIDNRRRVDLTIRLDVFSRARQVISDLLVEKGYIEEDEMIFLIKPCNLTSSNLKKRIGITHLKDSKKKESSRFDKVEISISEEVQIEIEDVIVTAFTNFCVGMKAYLSLLLSDKAEAANFSFLLRRMGGAVIDNLRDFASIYAILKRKTSFYEAAMFIRSGCYTFDNITLLLGTFQLTENSYQFVKEQQLTIQTKPNTFKDSSKGEDGFTRYFIMSKVTNISYSIKSDALRLSIKSEAKMKATRESNIVTHDFDDDDTVTVIGDKGKLRIIKDIISVNAKSTPTSRVSQSMVQSSLSSKTRMS